MADDREEVIEKALRDRAHLLAGATLEMIEKARVAMNDFLAEQEKNRELADWDFRTTEKELGDDRDRLPPDDPKRNAVEKEIEKFRDAHNRKIGQLVEKQAKSRAADLDRIVKEAVGERGPDRDFVKRAREAIQKRRRSREERERDKGRGR